MVQPGPERPDGSDSDLPDLPGEVSLFGVVDQPRRGTRDMGWTTGGGAKAADRGTEENWWTVLEGDCVDGMRSLADSSVDAIVTDPPYGLALTLHGEAWDDYNPKDYEQFNRRWGAEALRVAKPGAHLIAFSGTRTHHRMMVGLEDAGWDIRDCGVWIYRTGQPKGSDLGAKFDEDLGVEREVVGYRRLPDTTKTNLGFARLGSADGTTPTRDVPITIPTSDEAKQWTGWSNALKPAVEPWVLARKPLEGTLVQNVRKYGTGALNVYAARMGERWPANAATLDDDQNLECFRLSGNLLADYGKAPQHERPKLHGQHITVKPLDLMRWLVRLVCPTGGTVLEPFAGTGTTLQAARAEGMNAIGCERDPVYVKLIRERMSKPVQPTLL